MDRTIIVGKDREGWTVKIDVWQEVSGQNKDDSKGKNEQIARSKDRTRTESNCLQRRIAAGQEARTCRGTIKKTDERTDAKEKSVIMSVYNKKRGRHNSIRNWQV